MPFQPGQSGNPGGRPKGEAALKAAAREFTEQSLGVMAASLTDEDPRIRLKAAELLLDRAWGKPSQSIDATVRGNLAELLSTIGSARSDPPLED
jgi:hypothetical protein